MADYFVEAIRKVRVHGPYVLIGYSFGGVVMFETARLLSQIGERVAFLGMVESYPYRDFLSGGQKLQMKMRLLQRHARILARISMKKKIDYLTSGVIRDVYVSWDDHGNPDRRPPNVKFADADRRRQNEELALKSYQPENYDGKIHFVRAAEGVASFPASPSGAWAPWIRESVTDVTPGDHFQILSKHYEGLAAILSRQLRPVLDELRRRPR